MLKSKLNIALFIGAFLATVLGVMLISRIRATDMAAANKKMFLIEGYDFRQKRLLNPDLSELQIGTHISLVELQTSQGDKLSTLVRGDLLLMLMVESELSRLSTLKRSD